MDRYVELVQQYPGQQQVDLAVEIQVPGSWFGVGPMGSLTTIERRDKYNAQAVEYCEVREFHSCALLSLDGRGGAVSAEVLLSASFPVLRCKAARGRQGVVWMNSKPLFVRPSKLDCTLVTFKFNNQKITPKTTLIKH